MKELCLKVLWLDSSIAFSLDQKVKDRYIPLTEFYFWPQRDAWEVIRFYIEGCNWISQDEAVSLLNQITEIINCWQNKADSNNVNVASFRLLFPNVYFIGLD